LRVLVFRVKRPWLEADHLLPASAELQNEWSYTSTAPHAVMTCTATTLPFLLYTTTVCTIERFDEVSVSSDAYSDLLATFCNISFANGKFETRYM